MAATDRRIPLSAPDITGAERDAVMDVLQTAHLSLGPQVPRFEEKLASFVGVKHAIAVNSGTSALHLCVKAAGLKPGDEVITTSFSFVASANCMMYEGAVPVFVDIDPATLNMDPRLIESAISPRTKAILPVHVFGQPCDMDAIGEIAGRHNLFVIEDACEAIGATHHRRKVGGLGDCGVFAFYPNKQITTAEGGAVVTDCDDIASLCRSWRNQGRGEGDQWLAHERMGYNYRLSDLQCALGSAQLDRIDELLLKRQSVADCYERHFASVPEVELLRPFDGSTRSWFVYVVLLPERVSGSARDGLLTRLRDRGIGCSNYFPPIHLQPYYVQALGLHSSLPVTESVARRTVALPFHGNLSEDDVRYVVQAIATEFRDSDERRAEM